MSENGITFMQRGKPSPKAVVAIARELVGFVWAALYPAAAGASA